MKIQDMNCLGQEGISRQAIEEALKELDDCEIEGVGGPGGGGGRGGMYGFMGGDPNDDQAANGGMMKSVHDEEDDDDGLAIQGADHRLLMQEDVRQYVMQNISSISSLPLIPPPPAVSSNKTPRTRFSEKRQNSGQNSHHTPHPSPPNRSYPVAQTPTKANQISTAADLQVNTIPTPIIDRKLSERHFPDPVVLAADDGGCQQTNSASERSTTSQTLTCGSRSPPGSKTPKFPSVPTTTSPPQAKQVNNIRHQATLSQQCKSCDRSPVQHETAGCPQLPSRDSVGVQASIHQGVIPIQRHKSNGGRPVIITADI